MDTGRIERRRQRRRRRERVGGAVLLVLGVVVAIVAVVALMDRNDSTTTSDKNPTVATKSITSTKPTPTKTTPTSSAPGTQSASMSATASATPSTSASSSAGSSAANLSVVVLNNTTITGLAEQAASDLKAQGFAVSSVGNYSNNILSTCAYYDPQVTGAQATAQALKSQFSWIVRVEPEFSGLSNGPVVLILTSAIS